MSGTSSVPFSKDLPPPLVPLPSCHARVKQLQARLFNGVPLATSYIANCRLCLGSNFGEKGTTIIEDRFCAMLKHVFPFPITNQIGLPMNVCTECYKSIQIFYGFSQQVQMNQQKLQETLLKAQYMGYTDIIKAVPESSHHLGMNQEEVESGVRESRFVSRNKSQKDYHEEILIDTDVQCKIEVDDTNQVQQDPLVHPSYYDGTSLRITPKVEIDSTVQISNRSVRDRICFVDCKPNTKGNDTKEQCAESASSEFIDYRKKTRFCSEESGRKTLEQNAADLANRVGIKPLYICSICNEKFEKHHQLICHQKTHLMKECPICNQSIQYSLLAKHVIQEHAERARREKK